jgi:hypothetical protein
LPIANVLKPERGWSLKETLNKLIPLTPFDFAQESVRQAHRERDQQLAVRPEPVEGLVQCLLKSRITSVA